MPVQPIEMNSIPDTEATKTSVLRILCIDSENNWLLYAKEELHCTRYRVDVACSFLEAVDFVCTTEFDLITLSGSMCDIHYLEILNRLKGANWLRKTPIIILDTLDTVYRYDLAIQHGANGYASRPTKPGALLPVLRKVLRFHLGRQKWLRQSSHREVRCPSGIEKERADHNKPRVTLRKRGYWKPIVDIKRIQESS